MIPTVSSLLCAKWLNENKLKYFSRNPYPQSSNGCRTFPQSTIFGLSQERKCVNYSKSVWIASSNAIIFIATGQHILVSVMFTCLRYTTIAFTCFYLLLSIYYYLAMYNTSTEAEASYKTTVLEPRKFDAEVSASPIKLLNLSIVFLIGDIQVSVTSYILQNSPVIVIILHR